MDLIEKLSETPLLSLEDSFINELKCPICKELMYEQIFHCDRGHSLCKKCHNIGDNCNFCGSVNTNLRTHHLERIVGALTFPCKYFDKGCQKRYPAKKLKQHERECQTIQLLCPLRYGTKCNFSGNKRQIVFHCQLLHYQFTFVGDKVFKQKILHTNFLDKISLPQKTHFQSFYLYCFEDVLFQSLVQLEPTNIKVRVCRISAPSENDEAYDFLMKLYDFEDNLVDSYRKECGVSDGRQKITIDANNYVQISTRTLKCSKYFTVEFKEIIN